jgi:2-oxo-4-hydroxy-4-carboxy-5-ureidoimidazoline decarboxylase
MTLQEFNQLSETEAARHLFNCCGSTTWVRNMMQHFPFGTFGMFKVKADEAWAKTKEEDWREAFTHHPRIGDLNSLKEKFASTQHWASGEQGKVGESVQEVLLELQMMNDLYLKKFRYIFIICATGKTAEEMLQALKQRINNTPDQEIYLAAEEQRKIMHLRIEKLFA